MENLIDDFTELRISAFSKSKLINSHVFNLTIGPNATVRSQRYDEKKEVQSDNPKQKDKEPKICNYEKSDLMYWSYSNQLELNRLDKVQEAICKHKNHLLNNSKQIKAKSNAQWLEKQKQMVEHMTQQEEQILKKLEQVSQEEKNQTDEVSQFYHQLAEIRKQKERDMLVRKEARDKIIDEIKKHQIECNKTYENIIPLLKNCKKAEVETYLHQLNAIPSEMSKICHDCAQGKISADESFRAKEIVDKIKVIYDKISQVVAINQQEILRQQGIAKQKELAMQQEVAKSEKLATNHQNVHQIAETVVSETCRKIYMDMQQYLLQTQKDCESLANLDNFKQFRFDCKRAVNIPVNAISAASSQHLLEKYVKLSSLLSGHNVKMGDKIFNASTNKEGIIYCTDLLAHKFVLQADLMISSNADAAFCYATIIVSLWNDFPQFGKLLLAHFYKQCPYMVPMYIVKSKDQTDEDYYRTLGYQYSADGMIEKQDKYLKRLTGIMRLFSAIMVVKPKKSQQPKTPFGNSRAWLWLSSFLNLPPMPDVTATLLHTFLQCTGAQLDAVYNSQFKKVIMFIAVNYVPILKRIDTGGPVTRLELLLHEYQQQGYFDVPAGVLPNDYW